MGAGWGQEKRGCQRPLQPPFWGTTFTQVLLHPSPRSKRWSTLSEGEGLPRSLPGCARAQSQCGGGDLKDQQGKGGGLPRAAWWLSLLKSEGPSSGMLNLPEHTGGNSPTQQPTAPSPAPPHPAPEPWAGSNSRQGPPEGGSLSLTPHSQPTRPRFPHRDRVPFSPITPPWRARSPTKATIGPFSQRSHSQLPESNRVGVPAEDETTSPETDWISSPP